MLTSRKHMFILPTYLLPVQYNNYILMAMQGNTHHEFVARHLGTVGQTRWDLRHYGQVGTYAFAYSNALGLQMFSCYAPAALATSVLMLLLRRHFRYDLMLCYAAALDMLLRLATPPLTGAMHISP